MVEYGGNDDDNQGKGARLLERTKKAGQNLLDIATSTHVKAISGLAASIGLGVCVLMGAFSAAANESYNEAYPKMLQNEFNVASLTEGNCYYIDNNENKTIVFRESPRGDFIEGFLAFPAVYGLTQEKYVDHEVDKVPYLRTASCEITGDKSMTEQEARHYMLDAKNTFMKQVEEKGIAKQMHSGEGYFYTKIMPAPATPKP